MENLINYGIDLGTTNSSIAKFTKGEVHVFSNPTDFGRNTLPSVVAFKKDKIFVGTSAKTYLEKDPKSVVGSFKRKMGTSESFKIKSLNESKSPIELSAIVLKELKTFVSNGEIIDAAVITIPSSFDTVQSNATKEAGLQAGFKYVVLLQEPIAASLAYANMKKKNDLVDGKWLVYDLGGGTFDIALIKIKDGEMKVMDHEGDNFLGGTDFDSLIVDKIILPKINEKYSFENLESDLKSASGKFNSKYYVLLRRAEEAKIILSAKTSTEIVVDGIEDEDGVTVDEEIVITRSEFNELIKEHVDETIEMVKTILTRNSLKSYDVQFLLMVGGSTYIPYIRQRTEEILQLAINCEIDPTTAVAIGAAYYAASKPKQFTEISQSKKITKISIKHSCPVMSKEKDILFAAKVSGDLEGLNYRIIRKDGGFDTGLKKLPPRINEDLPLVENSYNYFELTVYDSENNIIETDIDIIGINSGYGISGQPLPDDICLETDDLDNPGETRLDLVFQKNSILPSIKETRYTLNKSIIKDSNDMIRINVLEGPHFALPEANKTIGYMEISGRSLIRDISKGSDIELTISMSESRDLTVAAYLNMANQEFKQTFSPTERHTPINLLKMDIDNLSEKLEEELDEATKKENYEVAGELNKLKIEMASILESSAILSDDDVTDKRYQLENKKRKLAQAIDVATKDKRILNAKTEYIEMKQSCLTILDKSGNDHERKHYNDIIYQEPSFLSSNSPIKIKEKTEELSALKYNILWRTPDFLMTVFSDLTQSLIKMNDQIQAKSLIEVGNSSIKDKNWDKLLEINSALINLLPKSAQNDINTKIGF